MKPLDQSNQYSYQHIKIPKVSPVPSLTTEEDQKYLYWLTSQMYEGKGEIVEIGTWFGSSAGYLAAGLRDAQRTNSIYSVDRFEFNFYDIRKLTEQGCEKLIMRPGDDTQQLVRNYLEEIYPHITLIKTSIDSWQWNKGSIELLHLDAPKRWSDIVHVLKVIGPHLIPNGSAIIAQDFCMSLAYALPLVFGALHESFELVQIPSQGSTMAVFMYRKPYIIDARLDIKQWDIAHVMRVWEGMARHFDPLQQENLKLGLAHYFFDKGEKEIAAQIMKEISA